MKTSLSKLVRPSVTKASADVDDAKRRKHHLRQLHQLFGSTYTLGAFEAAEAEERRMQAEKVTKAARPTFKKLVESQLQKALAPIAVRLSKLESSASAPRHQGISRPTR